MLVSALEAINLRAGYVPWPRDNWALLPLPAIAFLLPGDIDDTEQDGPLAATPVLVLKVDETKLSWLRPGAPTPEDVTYEHARLHSAPMLLLVTETEPSIEEDSRAQEISDAQTKTFGFSWFVPELMRHRSIWRDILIASLAIQLVGLTTPIFTQVIIDKVIAHQSESTLIVLGVALVVFMLFNSGMTWLRQYLILHTGSRVDAVLGDKVMTHLLRLPLPYFEQRPTGTLVARLQGVETVREFVSGATVTVLLDLPFLCIFLAVMFAYSWQLTLIALGVLSLIVIASLIMVPLFRSRLDELFLLGARNQAYLTEYISGVATVKSLQMEPNVAKRWGSYLAQYLSIGFSTRQVSNTYQVIAGGLEQTLTLSILIVGAWYVMQNVGLTVGMLVAFQMFTSRMTQPVMRLVGLWQEFQQASVAVQRLGDILDMPQEPIAVTPRRVSDGTGEIQVVGLGFRYSDQHPWLYRDLDLQISPGSLTVLSGPSGCGKSTLAKLLQGFYLPQEGRISIDGRDIRQLAANELRSYFGVVPQETVLFSGTVYENLVAANPHAAFRDVVAAAKAAEIHATIEALPNGYQTEIGERGTGLSGGQRQRLAIARALVKRPKILIFDEAISNLDQATAENFSETINRLKQHITILFITHQVPNALLVDKLVNM